MTLSSYAIVMFCAGLVAVLGILYVRRTHRTAIEQREQRRDLLQQAKLQPLPRMLQALGIGLGRYFYKLPLASIRQSIERCDTCDTKQQCEQKLRIPELNPDDIDFCSNRDDLEPFSRSQRIKKSNSA